MGLWLATIPEIIIRSVGLLTAASEPSAILNRLERMFLQRPTDTAPRPRADPAQLVIVSVRFRNHVFLANSHWLAD